MDQAWELTSSNSVVSDFNTFKTDILRGKGGRERTCARRKEIKSTFDLESLGQPGLDGCQGLGDCGFHG